MRRVGGNNPSMKHTKSTVSFVLKNVKGSQTHNCPALLVLGEGWVGLSSAFYRANSGKPQILTSQCLYLLLVLFNYFKVNYPWSMSLHRLCIHKLYKQLKRKRGRNKVYYIFIIVLKKWLPQPPSLLYQSTGSKSQWHQKLNSSHTC